MIDTVALREKVLDLAIRGKLVPQDPNDEPASVLLERIRAQKQQMVKDGKLKAKDIKDDSIIFVGEDNLHYEKFADGTVKCIEDEIPFELPNGWAWARLQSFCYPISDGTHQTPTYSDEGVVFLSAKNVTSWKIDWDNVMYIPESLHNELSKRISPQKDDILLAKNGTIGVAAIVDRECVFDIYVTLAVLRTINKSVTPHYLLNAIASSTIQEEFRGSLKGIGVQNLHLEHIRRTLIPIPPQYEQELISNKVDEIRPILEIITDKYKEFENSISLLKSKILDLAIRGKLVPQNPDDEPATMLLERIRAEKEELIKQGKIKRDKKESVIFKGEDNSYYLIQNERTTPVDETIVFVLPDSWCWTTLPTIANVELGKTLDRAKNTGTLYPYLRSVNIKWGTIDLSDLNETRFEDDELEKYSVIKNDLLICEGGDVGRCCVWNIDEVFLYQNALHRARMYANIEPKFYQYVLMSYESKGILKRISNGVTIKHLTGTTLSFMPIPLPPVDEQIRIIETIELLFAQLDAIADSFN